MKKGVRVPINSPSCGTSEQRNEEYSRSFSSRKFFDCLITSDVPTILDVGAHRGESVRYFKSIYPEARIFSFEPNPDSYDELLKVAQEFGTQALQVAVGDTVEDECVYYRQSISHMGGLMPIYADSADSLGYARQAPNEAMIVRKTALDQIAVDFGIDHVDILKVDVQGFELQVLQGASSLLSETDCVTIEVLLYDLYGKQSFAEVVRFMDEAGFDLWDVANLSKNPKNFRTDWMELVYRNRRVPRVG